MGYRSDVVAAFYVSKEEHFPVLKLWLDENFPMKEFESETRWFSKGMIFECGDVKWYESSPDVKAFDDAVDKYINLCSAEVNEGTPTFNYEFVRIGENYDDVDIIREGISYEYLLHVHRSIDVEV
jgi:hypothetical protein